MKFSMGKITSLYLSVHISINLALNCDVSSIHASNEQTHNLYYPFHTEIDLVGSRDLLVCSFMLISPAQSYL